MATRIEICNQALDHVGKANINALDEATTQAQKCDAHYDSSRRALLERSDWGFARRRVVLAELSNNDFDARWKHRYARPGDALRFLRVIDPAFDPTLNPMPVPFEVREGAVFTNLPKAEGEYTADIVDTWEFPTTFADALAADLAARVAWPLSKSRALVQDLQVVAARALSRAVAADSAQDVRRYTYDAPGLLAREFGSHPFWGD